MPTLADDVVLRHVFLRRGFVFSSFPEKRRSLREVRVKALPRWEVLPQLPGVFRWAGVRAYPLVDYDGQGRCPRYRPVLHAP
jgi:hypothetical protein